LTRKPNSLFAGNKTMSGQKSARTPGSRIDRRRDRLTADFVDVGVLFVAVFGVVHGENFFRNTFVAPSVYRRVLRGSRRRTI